MGFWDVTWYLALAIYLIVVSVVVATVLFERRDPVKAVSWITVVVLLPVAGVVFFVFFGQSYRRNKIFNRKEIGDLKQIDQYSKIQVKEVAKRADDPLLSENIQTIKLLLNNSKTLLTMNNNIKILNNGKATFKSIISQIKLAQSSIHLEYYIYEEDELGHQIADLLIEKAKQGVEVRFIYDDVGSWHLSRRFIHRLKEAGVKVHCFLPVVFPWFSSRMNYRNHRKIMVIDGVVGFTGGINIAQRYVKGTKKGVWRDTHLRIEGEAVRMLQITFLTDWYFATKELILDTPKYIPPIEVVYGQSPIQIAASGPDSDWASIMQAYFVSITRAKHHIYISTPYFMPNQSVLTALKVAALSGVDVKIMLPARSDSKLVHWASRSYFDELLEAKVKIYLYEKGFNHSKLMCVDSNFCSIGSVNMDERSFEVNFEITAMIYDSAIALEVEQTFNLDLNDCTKVTLQKWKNRKHKDNFKESFARLFSPLL